MDRAITTIDDDPLRQKYVRMARDTEEFGRIRGLLASKYGFETNQAEVTRKNQNGGTISYTVSFKDTIDENKRAELVITIADGNVVDARASIESFDRNQLVSVEMIEYEEGMLETTCA